MHSNRLCEKRRQFRPCRNVAVTDRQRKRIRYEPLAEHDYSVDKPSLREIVPGHFVQCNDAEYEKYLSILK